MNRLWLGGILLLVLLGIGIIIAACTGSAHDEIAELLREASETAAAGQWEDATRLFSQAKGHWQHRRPFTAAIADHAPMEEIDQYFAQAEMYLQLRTQPHFSACCQGLSVLTQAVGESQSVNWWNLL